MKNSVKNISDTKKKISFDLSADSVDQAYSEAIKKIRKKASIKGFRPGKIPDHVLETYYGGDITLEALNGLVDKSYTEALKQHGFSPVMKPEFDIKDPLEKGKKYSYSVEVEIKPQFEVKDYLEVPLKKRAVSIQDEEIETELKHIQEGRAELKPVEGETPELKKGQVATIDFLGKVDGVPFKGGEAKGYQLEYGAGRFLKDFEEAMGGMKKGETRTFDVSFPEDYFEPTLKGKKAQFTTTLNDIHDKELPKLDDEFAKDLGKESLAELKKEITDLITKQKERAFRSDYAQEAVDYLLKKNSFDVPEGMIAAELKHNEKKSKQDVEKNLRTQFILEAISQKENIQITAPELDRRLQDMARMYGQPVAALKKYYAENQMLPGLAAQIVLEKTLDFVIDKAKLK